MDAYKIAYDLLSEKVNFFEIYPKYFLKLLEENNSNLYHKLSNNSLTEEDDENVFQMINLYLNQLDELRNKSDIICKLVDCKNPLGFFQELMSFASDLLKEYKTEELHKFNIPSDDFYIYIKISKDEIKKINKKYY